MRKIKNIIVTGGSGFIGSNFINLLLNKNYYSHKDINILNIDKLTYAGSIENNEKYKNDKRYNFVEGDILDENLISSLLERHNADAIINFAAESHVDNSIEAPDAFIKTNILGTYNLLKCINTHNLEYKKNALFFHISTDEVFGSLKIDDPSFTENNPYKPNSPYSASKASSDHLVRAWYKTYKLPVLISNCSNNYGPNQNNEKLIPKIIHNALKLEKINIYGDGKNIRDWLYVDDHCKAIIKILEKGKLGETYNVGGFNEKTNLEIALFICNIIEEIHPINKNSFNKLNYKSYHDLITFVEDRKGHDYRYSINPKKIFNDLKWEPSETFDSGIRKTINYYLEKYT